MPAQEITITPKEQQVLRDYAHAELSSLMDIDGMVSRGEFDEAYGRSLRGREAMDCLDVIGWGGEGPHPIVVSGGELAKVARIATLCRKREAERISDADLRGAETSIEHCDEVLAKVTA